VSFEKERSAVSQDQSAKQFKSLQNPYKYFKIPFSEVPQPAPYIVWYTTPSSSSWSNVRPVVTTGTQPLVIGVTDGDLPANAELLGTFVKDPPVPPLAVGPSGMDDAYKTSLATWLDGNKDLDLQSMLAPLH
jgi:hypothetical protein